MMSDKALVISPYVSRLANSVTFFQKQKRTLVSSFDPRLTLIGSGRSAYVFKIQDEDKAIKVFYPPFEKLAQQEAEIYRLLSGSSHFPALHAEGKGYLVIDYIYGQTFFDCLLHGVKVETQHIHEVDLAIDEARKVGLNPSDIHLHNLMLTKDHSVKVIDVARFQQTKQCSQWTDLKMAYTRYYSNRFFPKRLPAVLLFAIAALYKKVKPAR
ncbi:protein kinase family protein [Alkalicoccobacillus plakortidis]|uniref:Protein kinase family protein n=1 Tax=Alkalicoccobacillus plakortidis TaxID=444060 RepID=A0ABT0XMK2_9BACI|nr:protein kinase family protein [Alkalicoccobacillus plakortidis]MCM2677134.1 protein kinase family protein [Alkalicoccobacillus plakortidis]